MVVYKGTGDEMPGGRSGSEGLLVAFSLWDQGANAHGVEGFLESLRECSDLLIFSLKRLDLSKGNSLLVFWTSLGNPEE